MAEDDRAPVLRYVDEIWNGYGPEVIDDIVSPRYANHAARTEEYQRGRAGAPWSVSSAPSPTTASRSNTPLRTG